MARVQVVKQARKAQGTCKVCGKIINAGDPYKWAKPRYGARVVVCKDHQITPSMTSSSKMVACWEAQEEIGKASVDGLAEALRDAANTAREVGEEYQEGADNQREYFPDSEVADENEERAQNLEQWADELESAADDVEQLFEEIEEVDIEKAELEAKLEDEDLAEEDRKEAQARLEEIEGEREGKEEEAQDKASEASDNCPD